MGESALERTEREPVEKLFLLFSVCFCDNRVNSTIRGYLRTGWAGKEEGKTASARPIFLSRFSFCGN